MAAARPPPRVGTLGAPGNCAAATKAPGLGAGATPPPPVWCTGQRGVLRGNPSTLAGGGSVQPEMGPTCSGFGNWPLSAYCAQETRTPGEPPPRLIWGPHRLGVADTKRGHQMKRKKGPSAGREQKAGWAAGSFPPPHQANCRAQGLGEGAESWGSLHYHHPIPGIRCLTLLLLWRSSGETSTSGRLRGHHHPMLLKPSLPVFTGPHPTPACAPDSDTTPGEEPGEQTGPRPPGGPLRLDSQAPEAKASVGGPGRGLLASDTWSFAL